MRSGTNSEEISPAALQPGDIILTGGFHFDHHQVNVANALVSALAAAHFSQVMLYTGNGQIVPQGGTRSARLQDALQGTSHALVVRPRYLNRKAHERVSQAAGLSRQDRAFGDDPLSLCHHPESIRFSAKNITRQLRSGQQNHLHQRVPHLLDSSGLLFDAYREAGFPLGSLDPRFCRPRDYVTAYRRGALQFVGILQGGERLPAEAAADDKTDIFRNLPKSRGFFIIGKKTEAAPSSPPPPPPARPAPTRDPLEDIAPAQAATLKAAAANGSPFCEP
ncbi:MAG: hypothetical protein BM485_04130 [Desulfobulbaceae bacterium DB1]|nr:MAG: hypothetical protein BM485_04130 [Desulfobulbaceae bacterium DB1]